MNSKRRPGWRVHRGPAVGAKRAWPWWPRRPQLGLLRLLLLLSVCALVTFPFAPASGAPPAPWSEGIFDHVRREYGEPAAERLRSLHELILANQDLPVREKLALVNTTLNRIPWATDAAHWRTEDYWATPLETIATFAGDCEDIAIAKWIMLRHLGIPGENLRLAFVQIKNTSETHMVLLYLDRVDVPWEQRHIDVLDNKDNEVRPGRDRDDLLAFYLMSGSGEMVVLADEGGRRQVKKIHANRKLQRLDTIRQKLEANAAVYRQLNDGRPLIPD